MWMGSQSLTDHVARPICLRNLQADLHVSRMVPLGEVDSGAQLD